MLTQHQINEFKQVLERRFHQVRGEIRQALLQADQQSYAELAGRVHDTEDASVADLLVDINLAGIDRHVEEIRDIDAALMRIADGSYGVCADCDEAIDRARLDAYPTAKRCWPCQTRFEERRAAPGSTSL
jgi:DnaK suppressor protein